FTGLTPATSYDFYARVAETSTHAASPASAKLTTSTEALITPISGTVGISGTARYDSTVTANVESVMPAAARATLTYAWLREGVAITGATTSSYTITAADIGKNISVRVSGTGDYEGSLTSDAVEALKAVTSAPAAPTLSSASTDTITLNTISGREYRLGSDGVWQISGIFSGLAPDTSYDFYARIAETATHEASPVSTALTASTSTTNITQISGLLGISGTARFGSTITAAVEDVMPAAARPTLHFIWLRNGRIIPGAYTSSYTITTLDIGRYISVVIIAGSGYRGTLISSPVRAEKAIVTSPAAPTLKSATTNKIALNKEAGQQYRLGNGPWQNSAVFTGLRPDTSYQFYTRKAETHTTMASAPSAVAVFKTTGSKPKPNPQPPFFFRVVYMPVRFGFHYIYIPYVTMIRNNSFWGF
ncbi:MAG: hypothetical protein GX028_12355, partial [Clostridiaceae bacterium]|nr:hypothetical protein [Clostridiaceae bacterium]